MEWAETDPEAICFSHDPACTRDPREGDIVKTAILGCALLVAIPLAAPAAESDLVGTWKLVSATRKVMDTGQVEQYRGTAPRGYTIYSRDGHFLSFIVSEKRPKPESVAQMTDQQRIDLFNTMNAYAGTYKLDGIKLTYTFDLTHNEVTQRASAREIKIEGRRLTIVNEPARSTVDGKMALTTTVWKKVE